jgi:nucleoside-diphosphate-sugar epimerase
MIDLATLERAFTGRKLLVTGSSGFLASGLIGRLKAINCRIRCVTRAPAPPPAMSGGRAVFEHQAGDIRERSFWKKNLPDVNFVFHFAAQTSVYTADQNPAADWEANVLPLLRLLETCREHGWRPGVLFAGSVTQCGLPESLPVNESHPDRPVTIYDWHKLLAESYLEHHVRQGWARGATLRLANVYGPGPASGRPDRGILNQMMRRAARGEPLTLHGGGGQIRDYLFLEDAADAFLAAAIHLDRINGGHFVVGSGQGHTLAEAFQLVAEGAARLTGRAPAVVSVEPPQGLSRIEDRNFVADASRFCALTGWTPRVALPAGIDLTLKSFQAAATVSP